MRETPDSWIERRPEDNAPDPADCCPVCGLYDDCVCPDDTELPIGFMASNGKTYPTKEAAFESLYQPRY
jgi:hypothetical protein